jgi:hypothetical protein
MANKVNHILYDIAIKFLDELNIFYHCSNSKEDSTMNFLTFNLNNIRVEADFRPTSWSVSLFPFVESSFRYSSLTSHPHLHEHFNYSYGRDMSYAEWSYFDRADSVAAKEFFDSVVTNHCYSEELRTRASKSYQNICDALEDAKECFTRDFKMLLSLLYNESLQSKCDALTKSYESFRLSCEDVTKDIRNIFKEVK